MVIGQCLLHSVIVALHGLDSKIGGTIVETGWRITILVNLHGFAVALGVVLIPQNTHAFSIGDLFGTYGDASAVCSIIVFVGARA